MSDTVAALVSGSKLSVTSRLSILADEEPGGCVGELLCLGVQVAESILPPQCLLQGQQAMLKASLTGAWLTPNEVLITGHTVPVPPQGKGGTSWQGRQQTALEERCALLPFDRSID